LTPFALALTALRVLNEYQKGTQTMSNKQLSTPENPASRPVSKKKLSKNKNVADFFNGFLVWPALNVLAGFCLWAVLPRSGGLGLVLGAFFYAAVFLILLNIGFLFFLTLKQRWWILNGIVTAFVTSIVIIWLIAR
jgi:lipopolysaccharide export LptBFGC system permease protein LptF